jgi:dTDP-4-dehydrorhamnose reductase
MSETMVTAPRILLFGTTGQVGWELLRALQPLGTITALSRAEADFEQPETLRRFFAEPVDLVVNAVAYTAVDQAEKDVDRATTVNATAVGVLAEEALRCGALLIHYSTDYVFDGTATTPYEPSATPNPQSQYGRSKLAGEEAIRASGCDHLILRTSWVYASRGKNFLKTILRLAAERTSLRIVGDQRGAPTSARLIADATVQVVARAMAERQAGTFVSGTYHLTASGETSWHGFASYIVEQARAAGTPALVVETVEAIGTDDYPLPAPRPAYSKLDTTSLVERFGVVLPEWETGVRLCLAELRGA